MDVTAQTLVQMIAVAIAVGIDTRAQVRHGTEASLAERVSGAPLMSEASV